MSNDYENLLRGRGRNGRIIRHKRKGGASYTVCGLSPTNREWSTEKEHPIASQIAVDCKSCLRLIAEKKGWS